MLAPSPRPKSQEEAPDAPCRRDQPDLEQARHTIDLLDLLEEKTRGNLTPDEAKLLKHVLTNLRLNYVDETRSEAGAGTGPANERIDSRTILDLSGEIDLTSRTSVFASLTNLTDEEYNVAFRPAGARPGAPRGWLAGVKLAF